MSDLPVPLEGELAARLHAALDPEGKIPAALVALAAIDGAHVGLLGGGEARGAQLEALGASVTHLGWSDGPSLPAADATLDTVVTFWSGFRGVDPRELAEVDRVLRPGGRLLVVHDYGRDDVSRLHGERPEYGPWSRRDGPFLRAGFRIRVLHCWWSFPTLDDARSLLEAAFGESGAAVAGGLLRPRLSYNVAVYHRTRGESARPSR